MPETGVAGSAAVSIAGVVLAAGSSTRMGRNKLLLALDGEPMVRRTVRATLQAGLEPVVVVLGHEPEHVREAISGLGCRTVLNPDHAHGVRLSVQVGIREVSAARAAVVVLADMPFVTAAMIRALVDRYREGTSPLVSSQYGDVSAPPTLYDRSLFSEMLAMTGEGCGKQVVRGHLHEAAIVTWPAASLADIDLPEDYEHIRAQLVG
jgi:molybdenum cofactor cytidylyltransferase